MDPTDIAKVCIYEAKEEQTILKLLNNTSNVSFNEFDKVFLSTPYSFLTTKDLEKYKESEKSISSPILQSLFHDTHMLPSTFTYTSEFSKNIVPDVSMPKPDTTEEETLLQIKVNYSKLNFLQAQAYILNAYLSKCVGESSQQVREAYQKNTDFDMSSLVSDDVLRSLYRTDCLNNFLNTFSRSAPSEVREPPSVFETKYYLDILKQNGNNINKSI